MDVAKVLPDVLYSVNRTPIHRIGLTPLECSLPENTGIVIQKKFHNYIQAKRDDEHSNKFNVGQFVRVSVPSKNHLFLKRSTAGFSLEVFRVVEVRPTLPPTYVVEDSAGQKVVGYFPETHMIGVEPDYKRWRIVEKILKRRPSVKFSGQQQYLVTFRGHSPRYRRWISEKLFKLLSRR